MPAERVPMRSVREILRLRAEGLSDRAIARSTRLASSTVSDYAGRAVAAGLSWPLPEGLTDTALEALLFVRGGPAAGARRKPGPDWPTLHRELRRPGVTLMLLWQEYRAAAPEGYGYSRFCELYDVYGPPPTLQEISNDDDEAQRLQSCIRPCRSAVRPQALMVSADRRPDKWTSSRRLASFH